MPARFLFGISQKNKTKQLKIGGKNIFRLFNLGLLLVPGFINAVLVLLLSSNRLFPDKGHITFLLLNISQLLSLGITISKYAADQMVLSRLHPGEKAATRHFFFKRVLPLALLFCIFLFYSNGLLTAAALFVCMPLEVFTMIVILELNVHGKYFSSLKINMLGYPLIFTMYIVVMHFFQLEQYQILLIFIFSSCLRILTALYYRRAKILKDDTLVTSAYVPLQQAGNYLLFKSDQVIIASNLLQTSFFKFTLPLDYLFYSKFSEVFSGIATSLGPILAKFRKSESKEISMQPLLNNRYFLGINVLAVVVRVAVSLILLQKLDLLHLSMLIPFTLVTILIVPVNIINYELYRRNDLHISNQHNFICLLLGVILLFIGVFFKSPLIFACMVPLQLLTYIMLYYLIRQSKSTAGSGSYTSIRKTSVKE